MKNHEKASELIFNKKKQVAPLSLIAIPGTEDLAKRIDYYLVKWWNQNAALYDGETVDTFLTEAACPRFSSGDGKALIKKSVRGDDVYIVADVGNYSEEYEFFGQKNRMSPDDHYQNLKRIIQAAAGKAHRINVIMPLLYGGRQHRRAYRESLDCAVALQELQAMSVENVVTFDAHDPRVCNAVPLMGFDNIIPYYQILKAMFTNIEGFTPNKDHFMVVSPDQGALDRNEYYASTLGVDLSVFSKRRDYSRIENGRNPIVAHDYLGVSPEGKDIFISDDIISSGDSMLDVATRLKNMGAKRIFAYASYPLFTNGLAKFDEMAEKGIITKIFGTNLTYRTPELLTRSWYADVDVSKYIAYLITALNHDISTAKVIDPHTKIIHLFEKHGVVINKIS